MPFFLILGEGLGGTEPGKNIKDKTMIRSCRLTVLISITVALMVGGVAHAQRPSALVLEKSGESVPEVQPYTEIPIGMTISLSPGARLVFQHYYTCRTVTLVGGKIRFGVVSYTITGDSKEEQKRTPCPRTVRLRVGGEAGGVMMRGDGAQILSTKPAFVLVGRRAGDFSWVRVSKGSTVLLEAPLDGRRFKWPNDSAALAAGTRYELVLIPTVAGKKTVAMKFRVTAHEGGGKGLLLIHVD